MQSTGVKTHRDHFVIDFDEGQLRKRIDDFRDLKISDDEIARRYKLESNRDWNLSERRKALASDDNYASAFTTILYRPFDVQAYFQHDDAVDWTRNEVMKHFIKDNIGLGTMRQFAMDVSDYCYSIVASMPVDNRTFNSNKGTITYLPLYLYNFSNEKIPPARLFEEADPFDGKERIENLSPMFRTFIDEKYGKHYEPEQIMGYIYAVLHSPTYRIKYLKALEKKFPRIPFVDDVETFEQLSELGWELVQAHLLKLIPSAPRVDINRGNMQVYKPVYDENQQRLYINKDQYFSPVPKDVWEFVIGGYPVLDRYLKSRKGRTLSLDEIENIQNIVKVLAFTITQMQKIDEAWIP